MTLFQFLSIRQKNHKPYQSINMVIFFYLILNYQFKVFFLSRVCRVSFVIGVSRHFSLPVMQFGPRRLFHNLFDLNHFL